MSYKRSRADFETDRTGPRSKARPPFVFYGTPLPPLDSQTRDDGTYVPLWQQEVRDERGRKRLHGAFTGGFSAGYFNTVGSKEGWTPSTFVSSRGNRHKDDAKTTEERAEAFMDEEDLADMHEQQKLGTQQGFAELGDDAQSSRQRDLFDQLLGPQNDNIGVKLLQRMGWKPGQGIGPKIKRSVKGDDLLGNQDATVHMFAPDDAPMITFNRKTDKYGLGWNGESRLQSASTSQLPDEASDGDDGSVIRATKPTKTRATKNPRPKPRIAARYADGSDEEEAYELGPKVSYNRVIGGEKKKKPAGVTPNTAVANDAARALFFSRKLDSSSKPSRRKCHDGRDPLEGYVLAAQALTLDDAAHHSRPVVPDDWQPSRTRPNPDSTKVPYQSTADAAKASSIGPGERASILGETALPGKSIFDFISNSARDRLAQASGATHLPQGKGESAPAGFEQTPAERQRSLWDLVPRLDRPTAQAALSRGASGWMPYAEDADKRDRYRLFLETMVGQRNELPARAHGSSIDEWSTEMREFAQAAMVFKPVSGLMASRFTSARAAVPSGSSGDVPSGADGLDHNVTQKDEKPDDPTEQAARLGMFGLVTRSRTLFYPSRLTCKRFGVKAPAHVLQGPEAAEAAERARTDVVGKERMEEMVREAANAGPRGGNGGAPSSGVAPPSEEGALRQPAVVDPERNAALETARAGDELFRAVFGDGDDEVEDE